MLGAVVPTYDLPGYPNLRFSPDTLAGIYLGTITRWNDEAIAADNPGVSLLDPTLDPSLGLGDPDAAPAAEGEQFGEVIAQGGVRHGIVGTLLIGGTALLISMPIGILAGVFLSEYRDNLVAQVVRFCTD